jgi:hypothetical protein
MGHKRKNKNGKMVWAPNDYELKHGTNEYSKGLDATHWTH